MLLNREGPILGFLEKLCFFPVHSMARAAFALIPVEHEGERRYLLQWNSKWECYNFIGGKVEVEGGDSGDFKQTIRREIKEEMGIELEQLLTREIKQMQFWQFSQREKRMKLYLFAVFEISFFPNLPVDKQKVTRAMLWFSSKYDNVYVSRQEIKNLETADGKPISKTVQRILAELGEL